MLINPEAFLASQLLRMKVCLPTNKNEEEFEMEVLGIIGTVKCMVAEHVAILFFHGCLIGAELPDGSQLCKERIA